MVNRLWNSIIGAAGALLLATLSTAASGAPAPAAQGGGGLPAGIKTIDNPAGGHIYVGPMQGQLTPQEAMGRVLRGVTAFCGARPQLGKLVKDRSGDLLAGFFTVKGTNLDGQPMEGLAMVYAPKDKTPALAVLLDDASRFPKTVNSMFARLQQEIKPAASSGTDTAGSAGHAKSTSASASARAKAQPLQPNVFPDGTGVIQLPADWHVKHAQMGDVIAAGPNGETLRFGWTIPVVNRSGAGPGNFVAIPYGTDPADVFKSAITQLYGKSRKAAPAIDVAKVQEIPMAGGKNEFLYGNIDVHDGRGQQFLIAQMIGLPPQAQMMGAWQITLFLVFGPEKAIGEEAATIAAIFPNYSRNSAQVTRLADAQIQAGIAAENRFAGEVANDMDISDRGTAGMSNLLRNQTVVLDTQTGGHGTTSDDLAGMLINANPSRFEAVPTSDYIKGIDY